jgi:hypothetical protein
MSDRRSPTDRFEHYVTISLEYPHDHSSDERIKGNLSEMYEKLAQSLKLIEEVIACVDDIEVTVEES